MLESSLVSVSETALFLATSNNHVALVRELLRFGADPSIEDETGSTCLQKAVRNESLEMCRMILEHEKYRTSRSDGDDVSLVSTSKATGRKARIQNNVEQPIFAPRALGRDNGQFVGVLTNTKVPLIGNNDSQMKMMQHLSLGHIICIL